MHTSYHTKKQSITILTKYPLSGIPSLYGTECQKLSQQQSLTILLLCTWFVEITHSLINSENCIVQNTEKDQMNNNVSMDSISYLSTIHYFLVDMRRHATMFSYKLGV